MVNTYRHMKKSMFIFLFTCTLLVQGFAQTQKFSANVNVGPLAKLLDSGLGFHVGVQPHYALWKYVGIEGLANYSNTKITSTFISGQTGRETNVNLLLGGRVYFVSPEKKNRVFANLLLGQSFYKETINGIAKPRSSEAAGSLGLYFQPSRFLIGIGGESPGYLFLRFGVNVF